MFFDNLYNQVKRVFSKRKDSGKLQFAKKTLIINWSSYKGFMKDDLVMPGDEGRGKRRYCLGELQTSFDPKISEWGNPP